MPTIVLSVIVPCYNNKNYIYACLHSIAEQVDDTVEIIIIDDGSNDGSIDEIRRFANDNSNLNVKIIEQKNQGVSVARNVGISHSSGKYIGFLDADDLWCSNFWEKTKHILNHIQPDMIIFNAVRFYNDDTNITTDVKITNLLDKLTHIHNIIDVKGLFKLNEWFPWARIYHRDLFKDITFPEGKVYEDAAIIPLVTINSKTIYSISSPLIYYRVRTNSITNTAKEHHIDDIIYAIKMLYSIYDKSDNKAVCIDVLTPSILGLYSLLRRVSTRVYGYCYFTRQQQASIKKYITPFILKQNYSFKLKIMFLGFYCFFNKQKYLIYKKI